MKPVAVRPLADSDIDAYAYRIASDNLDAALRFLDTVQAAYERLGEYPAIGSPRYAHLLEGLRMWALPGFENYLVFYREQPGYVDVIRVLHAALDIPAALQNSISSEPPSFG